MKKIIFTCLICFTCFAQAEIDYSESVEQIVDFQSCIAQDSASLNFEVGEMRYKIEDIYDILYNALYDEWSPNIIGMLNYIDAHIEDIKYFLQNDWYSYLGENFSAITGYLIDLKNAFLNGLDVRFPEGWANAIIPFLDSINVNIGGIADNFEGLNTSSELTNTLLEDIREGINKIIGNTTPSNQPPLSSATISYHLLDNFGIDVDTTKVLAGSFTLTGEFNKDVHQLLIGLNQISSSENYALLSILTNVQHLVSTLGSSADIAKVEQDISERKTEVGTSQQELYKIEQQNWDSFFTAPSFLSDVYDNLSVSVNSVQRPDRITIIDIFHYDSETFTCEISDVGFDLPNCVKDLVEYARTVFAFIYWSLTFTIALFFVRVWHRLFSYVLDCMIKP